MWLIRQVLVVSLILVLMCAAVVLIARANPEPGRLQALGFGVCEGKPCFRGITVGMAWAEVNQVLPDLLDADPALEYPISRADGTRVVFYPSPNGKTVETIELKASLPLPQELTLGDVVTRYGLPCRIVFFEGNKGTTLLNLSFPGVTLNVFIPPNSGEKSRVRPELTINTLWLAPRGSAVAFCKCDRLEATFQDCNGWIGFTMREIYHSRNKRRIVARP